MPIRSLVRRLLCGSVAALALVAPAQAACLSFVQPPFSPRQNEAAVQFYGPPPITPAYSNDCSPVSWVGSSTGPGSTTLDPAGWAYGATAQASPAAAHVSARSNRVGTGDPGPNSSIGAEARSVLTFTLAPRAGAAPGALFSLQFDVIGEGQMGGSSTTGHLGGASVNLEASSSALRVSSRESYHDSNGTTRARAAGSLSGPAAQVDLAITYLGDFEGGLNYFGINLDTLVSGEGFSDFAHTAKVVGITLVAGEVDLILPEGLFVQDGATHWTLLGEGGGGGPIDPGTVPEPASLALLLAAAGAGWARRRRLPRDQPGA